MMPDPLHESHWVFDGVVERVPDVQEISKLLSDTVRLIEMTPIAPPQAFVTRPPRGDTTTPVHWGGLQLIAESHIGLDGHGHYLCFDVFSCKDFDVGGVAVLLDLWLGARQLKMQEVRTVNGGPGWRLDYIDGALELRAASSYVVFGAGFPEAVAV